MLNEERIKCFWSIVSNLESGLVSRRSIKWGLSENRWRANLSENLWSESECEMKEEQILGAICGLQLLSKKVCSCVLMFLKFDRGHRPDVAAGLAQPFSFDVVSQEPLQPKTGKPAGGFLI